MRRGPRAGEVTVKRFRAEATLPRRLCALAAKKLCPPKRVVEREEGAAGERGRGVGRKQHEAGPTQIPAIGLNPGLQSPHAVLRGLQSSLLAAAQLFLSAASHTSAQQS